MQGLILILSNYKYHFKILFINCSFEQPFVLYKLAMFYYPLVGSLITITISMVISYFTGFTDIQKIDPRLLIPCMRPAKQTNSFSLKTNIF